MVATMVLIMFVVFDSCLLVWTGGLRYSNSIIIQPKPNFILGLDVSRQEQKPDFWVQNLKKVRVEKFKFSQISKKFIQVYK